MRVRPLSVLVVLVLVACTPVDESSQPVRIGVSESLTGVAAHYGESNRRGIDLAVAQREGHVPIEVFHEDNFFTAKGGVSSYMALRTAHDIDAVITHTSPAALSVQPLAASDGVVQMAVSASAGSYRSEDDLSFRMTPSTDVEAKAVASFLGRKGFHRIAIMSMDNEIGAALRDDLKRVLPSDMTVVADEPFSVDETDFRSSLLKIRDAKPDAVFMSATAAHLALILRQSDELGIHTPMIGFRATEDPVLLDTAGPLADGFLYTYAFDPARDSPQVRQFVVAYEEKYGEQPDGFAAEAYEGMRLLSTAYEACGRDNSCVKEYLQDLDGYESVFGPLTFDEYGDVHYDFYIKTVRDGRFVPYEE